MAERRVGVILHGVTGRMGRNQHLARSIAAIREDGGLPLAGGDRLVPDPLLVGRSREKLAALAAEHGLERFTTNLEEALAGPDEIFFDAATTKQRPELLRRAMAAGKHVYCEKPSAESLSDALDLARRASAAGIRHGIVQDKLFLPGLVKLRQLRDAGFFGRILSVRGDFGYWVFEGDAEPAQRPSWNYRRADGGGIILDMLPHWRYVLDHVVAPVRSVLCLGANHVRERYDEDGKPYRADADDAAYATFELEGGAVAALNSSWCTRVYRDDLVVFQVDGTDGSALAGLHDCWVQDRAGTPRAVWNPDEANATDFRAGWATAPVPGSQGNGFRIQWELFLRHVVEGGRFPHTLLEGAKGVQLAEAAERSWRTRAFVDLEPLEL